MKTDYLSDLSIRTDFLTQKTLTMKKKTDRFSYICKTSA